MARAALVALIPARGGSCDSGSPGLTRGRCREASIVRGRGCSRWRLEQRARAPLRKERIGRIASSSGAVPETRCAVRGVDALLLRAKTSWLKRPAPLTFPERYWRANANGRRINSVYRFKGIEEASFPLSGARLGKNEGEDALVGYRVQDRGLAWIAACATMTYAWRRVCAVGLRDEPKGERIRTRRGSRRLPLRSPSRTSVRPGPSAPGHARTRPTTAVGRSSARRQWCP